MSRVYLESIYGRSKASTMRPWREGFTPYKVGDVLEVELPTDLDRLEWRPVVVVNVLPFWTYRVERLDPAGGRIGTRYIIKHDLLRKPQ